MTNYNPRVGRYLNNRLLDFQRQYEKAEEYYEQNGLYDTPSFAAYSQSQWMEAMKPIRQVAHRSVEFYAMKVLAGDIQVNTGETAPEGNDPPLLAAIKQIIAWSNFDQKKPVYLRQLAKLGDLFLKAQQADDKVFIDSVYPGYVVDFEEDSRGYLTKIRIEMPEDDEVGHTHNRIEYWQKGENAVENYYSIWLTDQSYPTPLDELGTPEDFGPLAPFGIDFVNWVHIKGKDVGEERGWGCFRHAEDKMDEANRQATNLAAMVFKNAEGLWVESSSNVDDNGRPLPPPQIVDAAGHTTNSIDISRNSLVRLPAGTTLTPTIPAINWEAIRNIANDMVDELKEDLPELRYYDSVEGANLSGKALSIILAPALDRAREMGVNFATGLSRVIKMCLTMGQFSGVLDVPGTYDDGGFDHTIVIPDVFEADNAEKAVTLNALKTAGLDLATAMQMAGFTDEQVEKAQEAADEAAQAKTQTALKIVAASRAPVKNDQSNTAA